HVLNCRRLARRGPIVRPVLEATPTKRGRKHHRLALVGVDLAYAGVARQLGEPGDDLVAAHPLEEPPLDRAEVAEPHNLGPGRRLLATDDAPRERVLFARRRIEDQGGRSLERRARYLAGHRPIDRLDVERAKRTRLRLCQKLTPPSTR